MPLVEATAALAADPRGAIVGEGGGAAAPDAQAAVADRSGAAVAAAAARGLLGWAPYDPASIARVVDLAAGPRARAAELLQEVSERTGAALGERVIVGVG